jgi:hypothetical protein
MPDSAAASDAEASSGAPPGQGGDGCEEDPMDIPVEALAKRFKISVCLWKPMHLKFRLVSLYSHSLDLKSS